MYLQSSHMASSTSNVRFWRPEPTGDIVKGVTQGGYCSAHMLRTQPNAHCCDFAERTTVIVRSKLGQNLYSFQSTTIYFKSLTRGSYGRLNHGHYYYLSAQVTNRGVQVQSFLCLTTTLKRYEGESPLTCIMVPYRPKRRSGI